VVVDTLRADRLGCYGAERDTSPSLDALARGGVRFERAYATAPWTKPAVASMFTGLYPAAHGAGRVKNALPEGARTLAEILREAGYRSAGVVSHDVVRAVNGFAQGFDRYLESEAGGHDHVSTPGVTEQALAELADLAAGDAPFFLFVHYFDPHYNYKRHPGVGFAAERAGRLDGSQPLVSLRRWGEDLSDAELGFLRDLYDEEIRFTDAGIGRLLEGLERSGRGGNTYVVATADHGEAFLEHGWLGHTRSLYDVLLRVPLLVRGPGLDPRVVEEPVSLVGLLPTVLDLLGVEPPQGLHGVSLAPALRGGAAPR
jgi:arylsulfatase A-like enzyme